MRPIPWYFGEKQIRTQYLAHVCSIIISHCLSLGFLNISPIKSIKECFSILTSQYLIIWNIQCFFHLLNNSKVGHLKLQKESDENLVVLFSLLLKNYHICGPMEFRVVSKHFCWWKNREVLADHFISDYTTILYIQKQNQLKTSCSTVPERICSYFPPENRRTGSHNMYHHIQLLRKWKEASLYTTYDNLSFSHLAVNAPQASPIELLLRQLL